MRIRVSSPVDDHDKKPAAFEVDDDKNHLRVRIWHDGHWYEIAPNSKNKLHLRAVNGGTLVIRPCAANDVELNVDGHGR